MDLTRKQEIAQRAVESISQHFDETVENVHAGLDKLVAFIADEKSKFTVKKADLEKAAADKAAADKVAAEAPKE